MVETLIKESMQLVLAYSSVVLVYYHYGRKRDGMQIDVVERS